MWVEWTRVRFPSEKRRLFVSFLNLSLRVVHQPSWLTPLVMQTYGGGERRRFLTDLPRSRTPRGHEVWETVEPAASAYGWPLGCSTAVKPCLSMNFQGNSPMATNSTKYSVGGYPLLKRCVKSLSALLKMNQISFLAIKVLFLYPLWQERWSYLTGWKHPHVNFSSLPNCLLFFLNSLPFSINPNFTQVSIETHWGLTILRMQHKSSPVGHRYHAYPSASALTELSVLELKVTALNILWLGWKDTV